MTAAAPLEATELINYLRGYGLVAADEAPSTEALAGGVSGDVVRVRRALGDLVVKQALKHLRVPAAWHFDQDRIRVERDAMSTLSRLLPGTTPEVVFFDGERHLLVMTCAPDGGTGWKTAKLRGERLPGIARGAGALLAQLQVRTAVDPSTATRFAATSNMEQGRIDPYHLTCLRAHPDLAEAIQADVRRLRTTKRTLVHGDFSPKNLIGYPDGSVFMLDFEVAHWGDPAFDPAFALSHLVLAAKLHMGARDAWLDEAFAFWQAYRATPSPVAPPDADVALELGCLLLARIDGKSPIEYLPSASDRDAVRRFARQVLLDDERDVGHVLTRARTDL